MRILWLCNVLIPQISDVLDEPESLSGGWLFQPATFLDEQEHIEFFYCAPYNISEKQIQKVKWGKKSTFYGFSEDMSCSNFYDKACENSFAQILAETHPDIVHIIGTEYPHSYAMTKVFNRPQATIVQIQGLVDNYARYHFLSGLTFFEVYKKTFRDIVKNGGIIQQRNAFLKRGKWEIKAIQNAGNIMGRTDWDESCTALINPNARYFYCAENIRDVFYMGKWQYETCEKYRIFCSQGSYSVKGLHFAIEALHLLKKKYPQIKLVVAGTDILHRGIRENSYENIIRKKIKKYSLENNVFFTGRLSAKSMRDEYLKANVYILPSLIENESNSVDEAKMLGVPTVASYVGGVMNRIRHGIDGYLYQHDAPYMLCYYVDRILSDKVLAMNFSANAYEYQRKICDRKTNNERLIDIYKQISDEGDFVN